ncbi:DUF262 domain-containing protein [Trinickia violacea]|uniref:DUF262 domain-containing protein n=1 Tax=Trinickia violacea TaxID=2571746 RepID=A0A4V1EGT4_9BURK|nr:DUF262 domain-containing protein [Trinickia violacea]QCP47880.1 DUF262 domain-containing protein [Trinickia violacea]
MNAPVSMTLTSPSLASFADLFGREISNLVIQEIEIPLIQRDYAQGRNTESVKRIRDNFIRTLCSAVMPRGGTVDLDFVFGDVESSGKFCPLDGQQRLTTLFLLHCYLAWRTGTIGKNEPWSRFTYATRPSARDFCYFLVSCFPDFSACLSEWIRDQSDYLPTWEHDPSVQSMLTVLDTIHRSFEGAELSDFQAAWKRLIDKENPAIRFHVLPMAANGLTDSLYIKMNSRGRPLTAFENFKAHFEALLKRAGHNGVEYFSKNVDTVWSDILWPYRGVDNLIDNEFMRYFRFITEINAWRVNLEFKAGLHDDYLAEQVYGVDAPEAADSVDFLFKAFDAWKQVHIKQEFANVLTSQRSAQSGALLIFNSFEEEDVDLFHACCRHYGTRKWTLAHTLLLYGILIHRIHRTEEFPKRIRILRNLVEASEDEIRAGERNNMPKLLDETSAVIVHGDLEQVATFNQVQVEHEQLKAQMLQAVRGLEADLHAVEDHDLMRGGLTVFDLAPQHFGQRAKAFLAIFDKSAHPQQWKTLTAALLTKGDYSRREVRWTGHRLADIGAPKNDEPWRELFRRRKFERVHPASNSLMELLDAVSVGKMALGDLTQIYLNADTTLKDWRYYFVKYDVMRDGASGRYTISPNGGYQVCMLDKERLSSYYRDPYLLAIVHQSGIAGNRIANPGWPYSFSGLETGPRVLTLARSGIQIQCVQEGWRISCEPSNSNQTVILDQICTSLNIATDGPNRLYSIPQTGGVDDVDRVHVGATLLYEMVAAGL